MYPVRFRTHRAVAVSRPTEPELLRFRTELLESATPLWKQVVVGAMVIIIASTMCLGQMMGSREAVVVGILAVLVPFLPSLLLRYSAAYGRWRWRRAHPDAPALSRVELIEVPGELGLTMLDEDPALQWSLSARDARVVQVQALQEAEPRPLQLPGEGRGELRLGADAKLRVQLGRVKSDVALTLHVGSDSLSLGMSGGYMSSEDAFAALPLYAGPVLWVSDAQAEAILDWVRPIADALGAGFPPTLTNRLRPRRATGAPIGGDGDLYARLGVSREASQEEIKTAWRRRARLVRDDGAALTALREAYDVLRDEERRARYDAGITADPADVFSQFGDLFGELFGQGTVRADATAELYLTAEECASGCQRKVTFQKRRPCNCGEPKQVGFLTVVDRDGCERCGGSGFQTEPGEVIVTVPEGVTGGTRLRLRGAATPDGGPEGDLYVEILTG